ncbi:uncharacterized protein ACOB8E_024717 isoform 2-T3 [Sarcophilus harrisii]
MKRELGGSSSTDSPRRIGFFKVLFLRKAAGCRSMLWVMQSLLRPDRRPELPKYTQHLRPGTRKTGLHLRLVKPDPASWDDASNSRAFSFSEKYWTQSRRP